MLNLNHIFRRKICIMPRKTYWNRTNWRNFRV